MTTYCGKGASGGVAAGDKLLKDCGELKQAFYFTF